MLLQDSNPKMARNIGKEKKSVSQFDYSTFDYEKRICPVCGKYVLQFFDICEECNWQNDPLQFDKPDYGGGANVMSLNEARKAYQEGQPVR